MNFQTIFYFAIVFFIINLSGCSESDSISDTVGNSLDSELNQTFEVGSSASDKKVFIHYLPWFAEDETGRHWSDGVVNEPLIGYYDSQSWATHLYHILLSSAVGIDGAVINVRTDYDQASFDLFVASMERIEQVYPEFNYDISISYDDQDTTITTATEDFTHLKDNIIPNTTHYLYKDGKAVVFIWNYDGYLTSQEYRDIANSVFSDDSVMLLKNEIDSNLVTDEFVMNSFYPWVQGWEEDGSNWGEEYIDWFYRTKIALKTENKIEFITGAVWPGFDDRNAIWGQNRWVDRQDGGVYDTLWSKITDTQSDEIDWVILETWNDFNEGSEIEPIVGSNSFQYMQATADHIAIYKNTPNLIDEQQWMFNAAVNLYKAAKLIEDEDRDYNTYYPKLQDAIEQYLKTNGQSAYDLAQEIIAGS